MKIYYHYGEEVICESYDNIENVFKEFTEYRILPIVTPNHKYIVVKANIKG